MKSRKNAYINLCRLKNKILFDRQKGSLWKMKFNDTWRWLLPDRRY